MILKKWPIEERHQSCLRFGGTDPDKFLLVLLESVGQFVPSGTDGSMLAPEILDPFVFLQFVAGVQGKYTINGSPFFGNWRLITPARRMSERLFAMELAEALTRTEAQLSEYDPEVLDAFDASDCNLLDQRQVGLSEELTNLLINQFQPLIDAGECYYGTIAESFEGGDRLLAALAEWVSEEFPHEILPNDKAVRDRLDGYRDKAYEDEAFLRAFTLKHLPEPAFDALKKLGYRFTKSDGYSRHGGVVPVPVGRIVVNGDLPLYLLTFLDAQAIVDPASMKILAHWPYEWPDRNLPRLANVPSFGDQPNIAIDPLSLNSFVNPKCLTY